MLLAAKIYCDNMTGTGGTEVITRVMDLRSHSKPETSPAEKDISVKEEEEANDALICAEEKLMEDEEIDSVDEFGNPVADTEKIEDRMMTVALARSVIETSGGALPGDTGDTGAQGQHRYGLRTRRSASSRVASLTPEQPPSTRKQPPPVVSVSRAKPLRTHAVPMVKTATSNPLLASPPPLSVVPLVKPSSLTGPHLAPPRIAQRGSATLRTPIHTSHGVPNPLANFASPSMQQPAPGTSSSLSRHQPAISGSHPTTVPCPLSAVACPLPATAPSAEMLPEAATELIPRRGRIFSIDIDRKFIIEDKSESWFSYLICFASF